MTKSNLDICKKNYPQESSKCYRLLGDLNANAGQHGKARELYDIAIKIARDITERTSIIEALSSKGRWLSRYRREPTNSFSLLNEALGYAREGSYRIYETDIHVSLAWAHLVSANYKSAILEADYAKQMSEDMGYYWGKKDADEVLTEIEKTQRLTSIIQKNSQSDLMGFRQSL